MTQVFVEFGNAAMKRSPVVIRQGFERIGSGHRFMIFLYWRAAARNTGPGSAG